MAKIIIVKSLFEEIEKKFKQEATEVFDLMETLTQNPTKGKTLGTVGGIVIKEIKYKSFRFYCITDGFKLKCLDEKELVDLLITFIRMSDKNNQQKTIDQIKQILVTLGPMGFK